MALVRFASALCIVQLTDQLVAGIVELDPYLEPFKDALRSRYQKAQQWMKTIDETEGGIEKFSRVGSFSSTWWWLQY
jgi:hypothetical protein